MRYELLHANFQARRSGPADADRDLFEHLHDLAGGRTIADVPCFWCGPTCSTPAHRRKPVLRIWNEVGGFISFYCARCGEHGGVSYRNATLNYDRERHARARKLADERHRLEIIKRGNLARWLWSQREPVEGTIAEIYLRKVRGYHGTIPATLGFLPAHGEYVPALIAAFGMPQEPEPGVLAIANAAVAGVQLTKLKLDGSGKAGTDADKISVGHCMGTPLVLAPLNDGLGLVIAEGIEDSLSAHEATGLGAWAAGGASRLPALADTVPRYVETISIIADADADGWKGAIDLRERLLVRGGFEVRVISI